MSKMINSDFLLERFPTFTNNSFGFLGPIYFQFSVKDFHKSTNPITPLFVWIQDIYEYIIFFH